MIELWFGGGHVRIRSGQRVAYRFEFMMPATNSGVVVVDEDDIVPPRGRDFECRAEGLWFAAMCETPGEHWSFGLEAFGLRYDDAAAAEAGGFGERLAVGYDLEWEIRPGIDPGIDPGNSPGLAAPSSLTAARRFGTVFGTVLVGTETFELDGPGEFALA